jgi:tRNA pseudouridine55 synthase
MNGFLVVDKTGGLTSHDVVAKIRKRFGTKKVGHAGTLDPMATGVLVIGIGNATRLLQYVTDGTKAYSGTIRLGSATHTDDREGDEISRATPAALATVTDEAIRAELLTMVGVIKQRPSSVSAIKIDGKAAHQRIREGEVVEIPEREVHISAIEISRIERNADAIDIDIEVTCSAGTYIRSIARDLGDRLAVGGHLTSLRRTLVSPFELAEAAPWESAEPIDTAVGISRLFPSRTLNFDEMLEISHGRFLAPNHQAGLVVALSPQGAFAALLENKDISGKSLATPSLVAAQSE